MQKLKLDLEALDVASFEVSSENSEMHGTVEGQMITLSSGLCLRVTLALVSTILL